MCGPNPVVAASGKKIRIHHVRGLAKKASHLSLSGMSCQLSGHGRCSQTPSLFVLMVRRSMREKSREEPEDAGSFETLGF